MSADPSPGKQGNHLEPAAEHAIAKATHGPVTIGLIWLAFKDGAIQRACPGGHNVSRAPTLK